MVRPIAKTIMIRLTSTQWPRGVRLLRALRWPTLRALGRRGRNHWLRRQGRVCAGWAAWRARAGSGPLGWWAEPGLPGWWARTGLPGWWARCPRTGLPERSAAVTARRMAGAPRRVMHLALRPPAATRAVAEWPGPATAGVRGPA